MQIEISSRIQLPFSKSRLELFCKKILHSLKFKKADLSLLFVRDTAMREWHWKLMKDPSTTDVLSASICATENTSVAQIEAEGRVISPHERITPEASRDIIMAHVKDGIELGKKNKLPKVILNFIPEHQGTCVIYYFYKKALEQEKQGGPAVNADDYRYSGPKPQSKETAIALLADSVEASSRSLKDHSKESLKQNLKKIINEKFIDGQLEECDLTLKDLEAIAESFVRVLIGVHHTRVQYPEREQKEGAPKPFAD